MSRHPPSKISDSSRSTSNQWLLLNAAPRAACQEQHVSSGTSLGNSSWTISARPTQKKVTASALHTDSVHPRDFLYYKAASSSYTPSAPATKEQEAATKRRQKTTSWFIYEADLVWVFLGGYFLTLLTVDFDFQGGTWANTAAEARKVKNVPQKSNQILKH